MNCYCVRVRGEVRMRVRDGMGQQSVSEPLQCEGVAEAVVVVT